MNVGLVAFVLTLALAPVVLALVRREQLVDQPNERSSHVQPVPRGGGLVLAAACAGTGVVAPGLPSGARVGLLVASLGFAAIGLADDVIPVDPVRRLVLQVVAAAVAIPWLLDGLSGPLLWRAVFTAGCLAWLVSYVNAFNFMDGINGISSVQAVVAGIAWVSVGHLHGVDALVASGAVVAAGGLGFAPFNVPRARMFLGDVGSYFLGAWLAASAVIGLRAGVPIDAVGAPLALYLADTGFTLVARVRAGEVWHASHRSHVYQRLCAAGWSHVRTSLVVGGALSACAALGAVAGEASMVGRVAADAGIAAVLALYLAAPAFVAPRPRTAVAAA